MGATRVTGVAALASAGLLAAVASGCSTRALNIYVPSRNVDILFVVDDSSNTAALQRNLIMNFPAVRITQWVDSFGENGVLMSACGDNFGPAFDRVAHLLNMAVPQ